MSAQISASDLIIPMAAHAAWVTVLYVALTVVRAPSVWGIGRGPDGANPWANLEPRISANLRNQFEWPLLFYVACLLLIIQREPIDPVAVWLTWVFVAGRLLHSAVQVLTTNVRLRGVVFTVNFLAVLCLWLGVVAASLGTP